MDKPLAYIILSLALLKHTQAFSKVLSYISTIHSTMVALTYLAVALSAVAGSLAAPAAQPDNDAPDFEFEGHGDRLMRRQDYNQNYKTSGNVNFSPSSNGYSVTFSGAGDFVVGKGWKTGTTRYVYRVEVPL